MSAALALSVAVLAASYVALGRDARSDLVRMKEYHQLETYFRYAHLFERWGLAEQAAYLHDELAAGGLIDPRTGEPDEAGIRTVLGERGIDGAGIERALEWTELNAGARARTAVSIRARETRGR